MRIGSGISVTQSAVAVPVFGLDPDEAIRALFESGEEGAWYDPSDSTTVFQDAAGTTPAGVGDPVGLILDKSKGLTLGAEQVTNGTFDTDTSGWTAASSAVLSVDTQRIKVENGAASYGYAYQAITTEVGKTYQISFEGYTGGTNFEFRLGSTLGQYNLLRVQNPTTYSGTFQALTTTTYISLQLFTNTLGHYAFFDNISIRELPGNHATQTTSAARPVLQSSGGLYYLDFDGVDDWMSVTFAAAQAQPNSIGCGFKHDSVAAFTDDYRPVFDGTSTARHTFNLYPVDGPPGKYNIGASTPAIRGANNADTNSHVMLGYFNTTSSDLRIDASSIVSGTIGTNNWGGVWLGNFSTTGLYKLDGRIYSFVGVNRTLTAGETSDLESYLATKSGVTL